jgi:hypothetical protein
MMEVSMTEEKRGPGRPPKAETIKCVVLRDYWDEAGERVPAGTEVDMPIADAMDGVEAGTLSRVKAAKK